MAYNKPDRQTCFVIMPITTPEHTLALVDGDAKHYLHVLEHLFIPAVQAAGLNPIPPMVLGSSVIHAEIIANLRHADLVLCDISGLNPNVFFELGIRTALNRPACIVKDDLTSRVPFDTASLAYFEYSSSPSPWDLSKQVERLSKHIRDSLATSNGTNALWEHFGLNWSAEGAFGPKALSECLQQLSQAVEDVQGSIAESLRMATDQARGPKPDPLTMFRYIADQACLAGYPIEMAEVGDSHIVVRMPGYHRLNKKLVKRLQALAISSGYQLRFDVKGRQQKGGRR